MSRLSTFLRGAYGSIAKQSQTLASTIERHNLPAGGWAAKGFEFWTLLSLLLMRSNCSRRLELGSGRSTIVFAEYAKYRGVGVTSIETNRKWYNKARMELRWQNLAVDPIHLLKLDPAVAWYDVEQFRSLARAQGAFDFVMVDGPNEVAGKSQGIRDGETAAREILGCCANADVVIVDDVHRRHILDSVDRMLSDPGQYEKWFYDYVVGEYYPNSLCLCVKKDSPASREMPGIRYLLGLRLYATLRREDCPED
jgi:predicted O-methyltransferase YrrM